MNYYFAVDTETTGLDCNVHEILELGGILLDNKLNEIARGNMRLQVDFSKASKEALLINKIDQETWKPSHKSNKDAVKALVKFIKKNTPSGIPVGLICHNASFDIGFMKKLFDSVGVDWPFDYRYVLDTMQVAQIWSMVKNKNIKLSLGYLTKMFNINNKKEHSAMGDIEATVELLRTIIKDLRCNFQKGFDL